MSMYREKRDYQKKPLLREETQIFFCPEKDKSCTQQHFNEDRRLDSAAIVANYLKTGIITHARDEGARYIDCVHYQDFAESMNKTVRANELFESLDPEFLQENKITTPEEFVEFALDEKNLDIMRAAGLATPVKGQEPQLVRIFKEPEPDPAPTPAP